MSKNYVLLPNGELRHGEIIHYVDLDESELCHWKYIKRVKLPNGKYRYYYKDTEVDKAKAEYETAKRLSDEEAKRVAEANAQIKIYEDMLSGKIKPVASREHLEALIDNRKLYAQVETFMGTPVSASREKAAKEKYESMNAKLEKSFGYKVVDLLNKQSDAVHKAKTKVASWLEKVAKKLRN